MSQHTPLVSVLVPCYNAADYLRTCIESILAQSLTDIEIICINDGSTDQSQEILHQYAQQDARISIINQENSGYGAALNRGLAAAKGEFIAILEADDFLETDALTIFVNCAQKTGVPVVKANFFFYWSKPKPYRRINRLIKKNTPNIVAPIDYPALFWYMPSIWSAIYRRDFLVQHQIKFLETAGASYQDVSFCFKIWACADRVALIPNAVVHYRQDNENSSIHSAGKVFAVTKEFAEIEHFINRLPYTPAKLQTLKEYATRLKWDSYNWNYWRLAPTVRQDFFSHFHHTFKTAAANSEINPQYFFPWSKKELKLLVSNPDAFRKIQADRYNGGKSRYFWKLLACAQENTIFPKKWKHTKAQISGIW